MVYITEVVSMLDPRVRSGVVKELLDSSVQFITRLYNLDVHHRYLLLKEWSWSIDGLDIDKMISHKVEDDTLIATRLCNFYKLHGIKGKKHRWCLKMVKKYRAGVVTDDGALDILTFVENKHGSKYRGVNWERYVSLEDLKDGN